MTDREPKSEKPIQNYINQINAKEIRLTTQQLCVMWFTPYIDKNGALLERM